jgi:hypothetical protein
MAEKDKKLPFDPMDPQQNHLYEVELAVFPRKKDKFMSLEELQEATDDILARPWFRKAHPEIEKLTVKDGRGAKWSRIGDDTIHLLCISRVYDVLVHEIVHHVIPGGTEWHGSVYCGMLLFFVGKLYGQPTKDKLRRAFKRVKPPIVWDKRLARFGDLDRAGKEGET